MVAAAAANAAHLNLPRAIYCMYMNAEIENLTTNTATHSLMVVGTLSKVIATPRMHKTRCSLAKLKVTAYFFARFV